MTPADLLRAAAGRLIADDTPVHTAVGDWLDDTATGLEVRVQLWAECYPDDHTAELNVEVLYALPLAVARAVLEPAVVS
jgi:hypothetical protein